MFYLFSLCFALSFLLLIFLKRRGLIRLIPLLSLLLGYCSGSILYTLSTNDFNKDPFAQKQINHIRLSATVNKITEMNSENVEFTGSVIEATYDSIYKDVTTGKRNRIKLTKELQGSIEFVFKIKEPEDSLLNILKKELIPGRVVNSFGNFTIPPKQRNPGGFDYQDYLQRQFISGLVYIDKDSLIEISGEYSFLSGSIYLFRKSIGEKIDELHSPSTAAILRGLIIADRSEIDENVVNGYVNTGIAHILAVSGFNVAIIYLLSLLLLQKFRHKNRLIELVLRLLVLSLFLVITQFQTTVVRAVLMFTVHSVLFYSGRLNNRWNTLALTALLILVFNPQDLFSVSFQLSVMAVASLFCCRI
ncbi:MAG: ComEC/Rec2 family competence protein [Ignavibacteriales bacterium]|nr:ComEC/Rec2 family competence protein [Ignavibacteriales bacterium]